MSNGNDPKNPPPPSPAKPGGPGKAQPDDSSGVPPQPQVRRAAAVGGAIGGAIGGIIGAVIGSCLHLH
jgi:hypothetical protein